MLANRLPYPFIPRGSGDTGVPRGIERAPGLRFSSQSTALFCGGIAAIDQAALQRRLRQQRMRQRMRLLAPLLCAAAARALDSTPWGNYDGNGGLADVSALPAWRSSLPQ